MCRYADVKKFIEEYGVNIAPVKIVTICEKVGFKVFEAYLPKDLSGYIAVGEKVKDRFGHDKVIVVNLSDSARRRRFTIAHELAHYEMATDDGVETLYAHRHTTNCGDGEREANEWASSLLMPEDLVKDAVEKLRNEWLGNIADSVLASGIADKFLVSESAARVRLNKLKII